MKKSTPPFGGKALGLPNRKKTCPDLDSSPTPVIEMGYKELSSRMLLMASRLDSHALVVSKNVLKLDLKRAERCQEVAVEVRRIVDRIMTWPKLSGAALAAEKNWACTKYIDLISEAQELTEGKVL